MLCLSCALRFDEPGQSSLKSCPLTGDALARVNLLRGHLSSRIESDQAEAPMGEGYLSDVIERVAGCWASPRWMARRVIAYLANLLQPRVKLVGDTQCIGHMDNCILLQDQRLQQAVRLELQGRMVEFLAIKLEIRMDRQLSITNDIECAAQLAELRQIGAKLRVTPRSIDETAKPLL